VGFGFSFYASYQNSQKVSIVFILWSQLYGLRLAQLEPELILFLILVFMKKKILKSFRRKIGFARLFESSSHYIFEIFLIFKLVLD
jgi:hypothetical protein